MTKSKIIIGMCDKITLSVLTKLMLILFDLILNHKIEYMISAVDMTRYFEDCFQTKNKSKDSVTI